MAHPKCPDFNARIDHVGKKMPGQPRQQVFLTRLLYATFREMNDRLNSRLAAFGLNTTTMVPMTMIYSSPDNAIHPSELSHSIYSSKTNITRLTDELVSQGWVERRACMEDRRKVVLSLTPAGVALVEQALPAQWQDVREIWGVLSEGECAILQELFGKVLYRAAE
jgi:MarR family transcriptional repressor of emrRAB